MIKFIKKYYYLLVPFFITLLFLLAGIKFSQVDDCFMMEIANSYKYSEHSEFLIFINIIFGYIIKFLYNLIPYVNWFSLLYIAVVNIAFIPLYKITQNYANKLIFTGILTIFQSLIFYYITFTLMPFICSAAAVLWSLEHVKKLDKASIKHLVFSFLLFCIGFAMRPGSTFICIFLMFIPIYFFSVIEKRNSVWVVVSLMVMCIVANYGLLNIHRGYKKTIPEEAYFNQFYEYRATISDGTRINYKDNKAGLDSIGITQNDLNMYYSYEYADKNVFSEENLEKITQLQKPSDKYTLNILEFEFDFMSVSMILLYICSALLCFILFKDRRKEIFIFSVFVLGAICYLYVRKRAPFRVILPITVSGITTIMYIGMNEFTKNIKLSRFFKYAVPAALLVALVGVNSINYLSFEKYKRSFDLLSQVTEYVEANPQNIYITDERLRATISPRILTLKAPENGSPQPYNFFGDWYVYSYFWYDQLDMLGLSRYKDSTFKAVLEENVYVISSIPDMPNRICIFLKEHYNIDSEYEIREKIENTKYEIYKFSLVE